MPNIWTHIYFGEKVMKSAGMNKIPEENMRYFRLGTQGPDPFFYHNFWPWRKHPVSEVGNKIHHEDCGPFLLEMIRYGQEHAEDDKLKAYILGFITHHLLDRNAHPYIIYRSGNENKRHTKLETIIDTLLMLEVKGIKAWKEPVYRMIDVGNRLYPPIHTLLEGLILRFFPELIRRMPNRFIADSYRHMKTALQVLYDPTGIKHLILGEMIAPYSHAERFEEKDYLNLHRSRWCHPANDEEQSNATFYELLDRAEEEGKHILPLISQYWEDQRESLPPSLTEAIGNLSYDTGKDCTLTYENRFFDPIL